MNLLEKLKKFLHKNLNSNKPVLLAYSGGVDSSCLLDALLKCKNEIQFDLHVVHINHGWRKESEIEAEIVKEKMKKFGICFHYKKFKIDSNKNLENESRNKRIDFFKFLYKKYNYQALILAHQKDDLAETVLKRVLEGANVYSLTSMQEVTQFHEMVVWRPFLTVSRKEIQYYNDCNNIEFFLDKSNENIKYLRAKMRKDIFPYLQKNFNKEIINNLVAISSYSLELNKYLEERTKPILKNLVSGILGEYINLNDVKEILEVKYILKKIFAMKNIEVSRDVLSQLGNWILDGKPNLRLKLKNSNIYADRGCFFILKDNHDITNERLNLIKKSSDFGHWKVDIKKVDKIKKNSSWEHLFQNQVNIYVPEDEYFVCYPAPNKKLKKNWENNKVPSFLRRIIPVVCKDNLVFYDFLSGREIKFKNRNILQISLKLK